MTSVGHVGGPIGRFMRARGWAGFTLPLPFRRAHVFMWGDSSTGEEMLHEQAHVDQIERMGSARWTAVILWQYLTKGYKNAPLEIEARAAAGEE